MAGLLVSQQMAQSEQLGDLVWQLFKLLFVFGLVVFLAVIVTRLWVTKGAGIATGPKRHLRLLEHLPLGTGKGLCLVKVVDKVLLVSITDKAVTVLQEFPMSSEFDLPLNAANGASLSGWLAKLWPRAQADTTDKAQPVIRSVQAEHSFASELRQRLQRLKEPKS